MLQAILTVLTFVAIALVSGNNLSVCVGPAIGSRNIGYHSGILLGAAGFSIGLFLQGFSMIATAQTLLPNSTIQLRSEALLVAILVFAAAYLIRVPIPLTMSLVGLLAGLATARNMQISNTLVNNTILMWFVAPIVAAASTFYLVRILGKTKPKNIWRRIKTYKIILLILSFTSSYVLGANTIGLLVATSGFSGLTLLMAIPAIFMGSLFLSSGEIKRVSQELYLMRYTNATATLMTSAFIVEFATILSIPLSNTQAVSAAVLGAGMSYKNRLISLKPFVIILMGWIIAPTISFIIGLVI
jgi:PiT family inorganic phosphate transporter